MSAALCIFATRAIGRMPSVFSTGQHMMNQNYLLPQNGLNHHTRLLSSVSFVPGSYYAKKAEKKERRREILRQRRERKERVKFRREGKVRGEKRAIFREFFLKKKMNEINMDHYARKNGLDWKIEVAVILQRYNILLPEKPQWEKDFDELRDHLRQVRKPAYPKELLLEEIFDGTEEERRKRILEGMFPPGYVHPPSRITEADLSGNLSTIDRKLTESVFLFVKEGEQTQWHLPTIPLGAEESLLTAGRRAIDERVGKDLVYWCPGNGPMAVDLHTYPNEEQEKTGICGTKTFFMKFVHYSGDVSDDGSIALKDFAWVTKEEIKEFVKDDEKGFMTKNFYDKDGETKKKFYHYVL